MFVTNTAVGLNQMIYLEWKIKQFIFYMIIY